MSTQPVKQISPWLVARRCVAFGVLGLMSVGVGFRWPVEAGEAPRGTPRLVVDRTEIDLANRQFDTPAQAVFTLSNAGDARLTVAEEPPVEILSTLFGAYIVIGSFYGGLAATAISAVRTRKPLGLETALGRDQFHDLGTLLFGFCLTTVAFFWSQYAVIWYGNLPEETEYVILRTKEMPWAPFAGAVLLMSFLGPALLLISRWMKQNAMALAAVSSVIVIGMWLERYLLVVPSLWHRPELPLGWIELLITLGFLAAFLLTYLAFVTRVSILAGPVGGGV